MAIYEAKIKNSGPIFKDGDYSELEVFILKKKNEKDYKNIVSIIEELPGVVKVYRTK